MTLTHYLIVSSLLITIGLTGLMTRRNLLMMLLSSEIMLNAVNLMFVAFSRSVGNLTGQVFVFFIITVAAAEVAVGLAILVVLFRRRRSVSSDELTFLKW